MWDDGAFAFCSMGVDLVQRFNLPTSGVRREGIAFVGRLVEKKGVSVLLQVFALLLEDIPEVQIEIVGNGPLKDQLMQEAIDVVCADNLNFRGGIPNRAVAEVLDRSQVAVTPSIVAADGDQEGLGLDIVEA